MSAARRSRCSLRKAAEIAEIAETPRTDLSAVFALSTIFSSLRLRAAAACVAWHVGRSPKSLQLKKSRGDRRDRRDATHRFVCGLCALCDFFFVKVACGRRMRRLACRPLAEV